MTYVNISEGIEFNVWILCSSYVIEVWMSPLFARVQLAYYLTDCFVASVALIGKVGRTSGELCKGEEQIC